MNLTINGKETILPDHETISVTTLLAELNVSQPDFVTVELNGEILEERADFPTLLLKENDKVEFLYFMGGGR